MIADFDLPPLRANPRNSPVSISVVRCGFGPPLC
jgi:hypothetical protein